VLVVAPAADIGLSGDAPPPAEAVEAVARLVDAGAKRRTAASVVAELTGASANALYAAVAARRAG
jgi:hypothetical protein